MNPLRKALIATTVTTASLVHPAKAQMNNGGNSAANLQGAVDQINKQMPGVNLQVHPNGMTMDAAPPGTRPEPGQSFGAGTFFTGTPSLGKLEAGIDQAKKLEYQGFTPQAAEPQAKPPSAFCSDKRPLRQTVEKDSFDRREKYEFGSIEGLERGGEGALAGLILSVAVALARRKGILGTAGHAMVGLLAGGVVGGAAGVYQGRDFASKVAAPADVEDIQQVDCKPPAAAATGPSTQPVYVIQLPPGSAEQPK